MRKIFALILAGTLFISTVACENGSKTTPETTSVERSSSDTSSVATSETSTGSVQSGVGMPSWLYLSGGFENKINDVLYIGGTEAPIYSYALPVTAETVPQMFGEKDESISSPYAYGDEVYALKYDQSGSSDVVTKLVSLVIQKGETATLKGLQLPSISVNSPVLIGSNIYFINEDFDITKMDALTGEASVIYAEEDVNVPSFTYDSEYLYFQGATNSEIEAQKIDQTVPRALYRLSLNRPTEVESFLIDGSQNLDYVVNGKIYLSWVNDSNTLDRGFITWGNSEPTIILPTIEHGDFVNQVSPYLEYYAVSTSSQDGTIYLDFYDAESNFVRSLVEPVLNSEDTIFYSLDFSSFGDSLTYRIIGFSGDDTTAANDRYFINKSGETIKMME